RPERDRKPNVRRLRPSELRQKRRAPVKKQLDHSIARKENAKPRVLRRNLLAKSNKSKRQCEFAADRYGLTLRRLSRRLVENHSAVWLSAAAVSTGSYCT